MVNLYTTEVIKPLFDKLSPEMQFYARNLHKLYVQEAKKSLYKLSSPSMEELLKQPLELKKLYLKRVADLARTGKFVKKDFLWQEENIWDSIL